MKIKSKAIASVIFAAVLSASAMLLFSCAEKRYPAEEAEKTEANDKVNENTVGTYVINTYKDLIDKIPEENNAHVMLAGYYSQNDGGGGEFYWDAESTAEHNGGTVIKPTKADGAGRYIRICEPGYVNVKWFGAIGDNSTDDAPAIQAAIDSLPSDGGEVNFPGGHYVIKSPLTVGDGDGETPSTKNGIKLVGSGAQFGHGTTAETTIVAKAKIEVMLTVKGPISDCGIEGIKFNANNNAANGITFIAMSQSYTDRVQLLCFNNTGFSILGGKGEKGISANNLFTQTGSITNVDNATMVLIDGDYESGAVVSDAVFTACRFDTGQQHGCVALHIKYAERLSFKRCHFNVYKFDTSEGLLLDGTENDGYPKQNSYYDCSGTRMDIKESENGKIGYNFFLGHGSGDHELYVKHPKIFGILDFGLIMNRDEKDQ